MTSTVVDDTVVFYTARNTPEVAQFTLKIDATPPLPLPILPPYPPHVPPPLPPPLPPEDLPLISLPTFPYY